VNDTDMKATATGSEKILNFVAALARRRALSAIQVA
jgi:hypothetical protein